MTSRKYILIGLIFLAAVGAAFLSFTTANTSDVPVLPREVLLDDSEVLEETIAHETQNEPKSEVAEERMLYTIPVTETGTALEAMRRYTNGASDFSFTTRAFPGLGEFIESINGVPNDNGFYWTLFINGALSEYGASSLSVAPGDLLEWRYQKGI